MDIGEQKRVIIVEPMEFPDEKWPEFEEPPGPEREAEPAVPEPSRT